MDGILNIDKPQGWTSHDVVARVRRLTRQKRVGHAGTLDPMATGVLLVCLGRATRLSEYLMSSDKIYRAVVRLGVETDTYDAEGQIVAERPVNLDEATLRGVLKRFMGEVDQVPPMYSALKRNGKPLYKLARQGVEVAREARRVTIYDIVLRQGEKDLSPRPWVASPTRRGEDINLVTIDVRCSPGTYIRSLAHDIGALLGCGAHLAALTRLASGQFTLDRALPLQALEDAVEGGAWTRQLYPLDAALQDLPAVTLEVNAARRLGMGQAIAPGEILTGPSSRLHRAYDADGTLVALIAYDAIAQLWRPKKVLVGDDPS